MNKRNPYRWNSSSIVKILSTQEYCGDVINFKTYSKSFKHKDRLPNSKENWAVFKDVHEPIIDQGIWEQIQKKRSKIRKRTTSEGEKTYFRDYSDVQTADTIFTTISTKVTPGLSISIAPTIRETEALALPLTMCALTF